MNEDNIAVTGIVGSDPRTYVTAKGVPIVSFRLASSRRVFDRERGEWHDGETNWYTVSAFRRLADHVGFSVRKGEHVVVTGRLRIRAWQTAERQGTTAEIDAEAIGHDLNWAMTRPRRIQPGVNDEVQAIVASAEPGVEVAEHTDELDELEELDDGENERGFDDAFQALAGPST
ncbi:single-stranded DNA-binding protein [Agromyces soli]|uniref:Single-stranded DNA-binding protein n=1 Tax=Agromyces soli TaxID=659012 RepID=A0ABY4AQ74_9MICO|nr:single-stranded DNA-binding protein [Agromyces soli]UOE25273.1 single-stranded DNA-binding protein [Agromyces soli]